MCPVSIRPTGRDSDILIDSDACWTLQALPAPRHLQALGIANSAPAHALGSEWMKRIAHKAILRQMHCPSGLAGAVRRRKMVIWPPKDQYSCSLAPHLGRIWHHGGTPRKSKS
eukprot:gene8185-biopygen15144